METYAARSTSTKEKKLTSPPSRRSFAKRSPSTVLASRNLRRKRSPKGFRPEQVRHRAGGGVVPPERTQVEDGLDSRKERIVGILDPARVRRRDRAGTKPNGVDRRRFVRPLHGRNHLYESTSVGFTYGYSQPCPRASEKHHWQCP